MLNNREVKAADILNSYVMALNREKMWKVFSPEFGDDAVKFATIIRVLHGLKSAGVSFRAHLVQFM